MSRQRDLTNAVSASLFAAAAAWPTIASALMDLTLSPYERALRGALCGSSATNPQFLGHCAVCWEGAAAFAFAGGLLLALRHLSPRSVSASAPS